MAIIANGLLSGARNKVGGIVCFFWKGIPVAREYKIPANPNTASQQAQRGRFAAATEKAKTLLSTVIINYWNPFAVKMSGFNAWMKYNINALAATTYYYTTSNYMSRGSLEGADVATAVLADGVVTCTWDETVVGNGALTDEVDLIVVNKETGAVYQSIDTYTRDNETGTVTCTGETDETKLIAFLVIKRGSGSSYVVSDSTSLQVTS